MSDETELNAMGDSEGTVPDEVACAWWKRPRIAVPVAVVLFALAGGGVYAGVNAYQTHQALLAFSSAVEANSGQATVLSEAVAHAQAVRDEANALNEASGDTPVIAPALIESVDDALSRASALDLSKPATPVDRATLVAMAEELEAETANTVSILDSLKTVTDAVEAELNTCAMTAFDKAVADAQSALSSAQGVLDGSDGKVNDNSLRDALATAIDSLTNLLPSTDEAGDESQSSSVEGGREEVKAKTAEIASGIEDLNAKSKAVSDDQTAWQQAQDAQAQASSTSAGGGASYSGSSYDYSGGAYTGGGSPSDYSGGSSTDLGSSGYWYNHNYPEYVYDPDGWRHHQIQPDSNGHYQTTETVIP
ncbi:hypothetical protein [Pauljensenia sp. UMB0895]|uniref:hypothetical protein n=1 Tax=Pauljensenia sp. UMB0895 TaxID=3046319 RepID=UPI00254AFB99|nr:hypothetical protein [Pauljensenia sp. UMB0895]MDK7337762.1 hypothetical protein [Pauljensenia sp. UMB0895]